MKAWIVDQVAEMGSREYGTTARRDPFQRCMERSSQGF